MNRLVHIAISALRGGVAAALLWFGPLSLVCAASAAERGEYILRVAGCVACHTNVDAGGPALAGGRGLETPFGTFYTPNITSDPVHGIGAWTEDEFRKALTRGVAPNGTHYYPAFPFTAYSGMKPADVSDLFAYLKSVPPIATASPGHDLPWLFRFRIGNSIWRLLFFDPRAPEADRGEYLVKSLGHCDECHSPRNLLGVIDYARHLRGNPLGPEGASVPNITPDRDTGIGRWGRSDLLRYLRNGMLPDMDFVGGAMVEVIDEGLKFLTDEDREAIADYLRALSPATSEAGDG